MTEPASLSKPDDRSTIRVLATPVALLTVLMLLAVILAVGHRVMLQRSRAWVTHTHRVIETTQTLFSYAQDVESGARGFALTRNPKFLDAYPYGITRFPVMAARLHDMVADNPDEQARVDRLIALLRARIDFAAARVALGQQGRWSEALDTRVMTGKVDMDQSRVLIAEILHSETLLLQARNARADQDELVDIAIVLIVGGLAFAGIVILVASMARANRRMVHEIAEREAAEIARDESETLYRTIFANAVDYIYVIDVSPEGRFTVAEFNPAFEQATGWTTAAMRGQDLEMLGPQVMANVIPRLRQLLAGEALVVSRDNVVLSGGQRVWESIMVAVRTETGALERVVGSTRDVTERDRAEEQLRRAQRMEAVGHLTGGVAHDFNNLLQVIRGNLEMLMPLLEGQDAAMRRATTALRGADRAAQLTRQLLAFARRQPLEPKVVNLGRLVVDMSDMLRRTLGESVQVETVLAGGLWNTLADPAQVESAILNLAINARDAMPGNGKLTIEIGNAVLDQGYASRDDDIEPGEYVMLAVSDTGHGMSKDTLARVFEPFFTTKSEEKGTGLGLSMVYGFVKQSNGHVQIYSEVGQGTTVKIYLPRARQDEEQLAAPMLEAPRGSSQVILVVEDDDMVRSSAVGMLRDLGYICLHAADGAQALEILQQDVKVDLLFTDVIMPGPVKSRELVRQAQALRPGMPVLFTSGYTENAIVHHGRLDEGLQLLSKPYTRDQLARRIGGLLAATRPVVLVVEDDGLVRMSAVDMVAALGFTVLEAEDADAALTLLDGEGRIDILFTDVGLPGLRGPQLAERALALRPDLKVIFASGYGETDETLAVTGAVHLDKPYEQDELARVLGAASS